MTAGASLYTVRPVKFRAASPDNRPLLEQHFLISTLPPNGRCGEYTALPFRPAKCSPRLRQTDGSKALFLALEGASPPARLLCGSKPVLTVSLETLPEPICSHAPCVGVYAEQITCLASTFGGWVARNMEVSPMELKATKPAMLSIAYGW
jgi:hypothetical protein